MKITILTDNPKSWIIPYVKNLKEELILKYDVTHIFSSKDIAPGDVMLILSCEKILKNTHLSFHKSNIVVHPSKLPLGKGWSPLAWQILEGENNIPLSLFEANDKVDDGDIYILDYIKLEGHELNDEIKHQQGLKTLEMIREYLDNFENRIGKPQQGDETFYPKRPLKASELDLNKSLNKQFNLLRVVDNERYPAYFIKDGVKYILKIYKEI